MMFEKYFLKKDILKKVVVSIAVLLLIAIVIMVIFIKRKTVTVIIDNKQIKIATFKSTVGTALESKKIFLGVKDKIEPSLESKLTDKDIIIIKRAVNVKIDTDGTELNIKSSEDDVNSLLKAENISLNDQDKVNPDKSTKLSEGMQVEVIRVVEKTFTESVSVDFSEIIKTDKTIPNIKRKILQEGKTGEKQIITSVVYENGNEVSRKIVSDNIIKEPIDKIIVQGTFPLMPVSRSGEVLPCSKVFKANATAYWAVSGIGKTYTASGRKAVRNPDGYSTIAVDSNVISYGTKVFVEGYGFAIAADTGTDIIGNTIDVFFDTYNEACSWGLKNVNIYILK